PPLHSRPAINRPAADFRKYTFKEGLPPRSTLCRSNLRITPSNRFASTLPPQHPLTPPVLSCSCEKSTFESHADSPPNDVEPLVETQSPRRFHTN
ncbi:Uncharacterized protein HZ326_8790, partial [Fusarium oxysporum f. sp. albedinis]